MFIIYWVIFSMPRVYFVLFHCSLACYLLVLRINIVGVDLYNIFEIIRGSHHVEGKKFSVGWRRTPSLLVPPTCGKASGVFRSSREFLKTLSSPMFFFSFSFSI